MKEIRKALNALGVSGKVSIKEYDSFTLTVYVDSKKFGLWDKAKKTFVD